MSSTEQLNQHNLKKTVSTPAAITVAFNQIVGGGIVSLTGVAIALTGGGVSIAFLIAILTIIIVSLPYAAIGSAMPTVGGVYSYATRLIHPTAGYFSLFIHLLVQISIGLYGISAGAYMNALNPEFFDTTVVAVVIVVAFWLANTAGAVIGARVSLVMSVLMIIGFGIFIVVGLMNVDWVNYPPVLPNGFSSLIQAAALLTFATGGATVVVELGGEMKNPGRAIPIAMIGGTFIAGLMYIAIALVAAGVLPIDQVAGQLLNVVAGEFLPKAAWIFFILGGAMVALISTLNSQMLTSTKSFVAAVDDGWLPQWLGAVNKRFGTPHWLLLMLLVVALTPVLTNLEIGEIGSAASAFAQIIFIFVLVASLRLRYVRPDLHAKAPFKMPAWLHWILVVLGIAICIYQSYLLFAMGVSNGVLIAVAILAVVALIWGFIRYPHVKRVLGARREATGSIWVEIKDNED